MSINLVTFNIRYEKSQVKLKMEFPIDVFFFIEKLKIELKINEKDEVVILCPTSEGKMLEIKSNDDIAYIKKTKLSFDSENKEIYCSAELVVSIIHEQLPDDPKVQIMVLSNKFDQLTSQFEKVSQALEHKIEENTNILLNNIKLIVDDHSKTNLCNIAETNSSAEQNNSGAKQNKVKNKNKKSSNSSDITTNKNMPLSNENINMDNKPLVSNDKPKKDTDSLLKMLKENGFSNPIQNIIVLKRFDNDYEKVVEYLKNSS